jgi:hypothetical protein
MFKGLKEANASGSGNYLKAGVYGGLRIREVKQHIGWDKVPKFIVEMDVVDHTPATAGGATDAPGAVVSWVVSLDGNPKTQGLRLGDIKAFLAAAFKALLGDECPEEIDEADGEAAISAEQPLAGVIIGASCALKKTKEKGNDFTKVTWKEATAAA